MTKRHAVGWIALLGFLLSIPFANWWLDTHGFWEAPVVGWMLPSALWVVGISFCLRDLAQLTLGRLWAWGAIAVGAGLSWWLASPALAVASGVAFLVSETFDALIYTPLAERRFMVAVFLSGLVASFIDSALFLRIAFDSFDGWWELGIAKAVVVLAATPVAWLIRRSVR